MDNTLVPKDLIEEIGLDALPLEEQVSVLSSMGDALMAAILARVVPMLDDTAKQELDTLLGGDMEPQQLQDFLSSKIENFQSVLDEEVEQFRTEAIAFYRGLGAGK